ncbi:protein adenylyltransferase SelO family protein [Photobacterium kishitanii]|uniref:protein adenylyltransferase SelO family protein n=1 Tax=Photobacterium kishitanii TaxID=318456 RepID=UPI0005D39F11|nr:protein adenylyltransferase SelO family protein [Photobacterium kishitanii]PSV07927.1 MchC protein [Photobacterium kishitanii]PSV72905.1 MchC protein [Photobacterium kishitanii]PSW47871.1 MchC protein [Photobacterium kishitanii]
MSVKTISVRKIKKLNFIETGLPEISFSSFDTFRLIGAELAWFNSDLLKKYNINGSKEEIEAFLLNEYSYVSPNYLNSNRLIINECKTFWADRYGSRHEVCNGGSARCGFDGVFQVKGIGITPLLAQNMSKSHSHGKLFLDEAISEAIWGEICHRHLPYGSIRTLAIIKTNVQEEFSYLGNSPKKPCALAIREFSIRPAHFERATFFWPLPEYISLRNDDADRVRECINYLPISLGVSDSTLSSKKELFDCLKSFVVRIAKQIAYSRVKGIPHGSLTSSNISIDGRFLDFGTITAVPDFGNYVLADGVGAVWDDHILITNWLKNLFLNIDSYSILNDALSNSLVQELVRFFLDELEYQENYAILEELDVKNKSKDNLILAGDIKRNLISRHRINIGDFCAEDFKSKIVNLAKEKRLKIGNVKFELRDLKYSSFTIFNDEYLSKTKYSNESINRLIANYC